MKKRLAVLVAAVVLLVSLAACGGNAGTPDSSTPDSSVPDSSQAEYQEFSLDINGTEVTYTKAPERVVALNYECAQVLVALGLEDKIVGITAGHFKIDECLPEYREKLAALKDLGQSVSYEAILAESPDLVYGHSWVFNAESTADPAEYIEDGIAIYAVKGDYQSTGTFEFFYDDLANLGKIFGVEDKADALIAGMKERVEKVKAEAVTDAPTVFVYDSGDKQAYTAGSAAMQSEMLRIVGAKNIFEDIDAKYQEVSWEEVANRNPQWILINEYEDENLGDTTKEEFLKTNPALENCDAVKNDRFISINLLELREGLQAVDGLEKTLAALKGN